MLWEDFHCVSAVSRLQKCSAPREHVEKLILVTAQR